MKLSNTRSVQQLVKYLKQGVSAKRAKPYIVYMEDGTPINVKLLRFLLITMFTLMCCSIMYLFKPVLDFFLF